MASRREILVGATIASSIVASTGLSACSPAPFEHITAPGRFFSLVARGELVLAKQLLSDDASLSVVSSIGAQHFTDAQGIAELLGGLLGREGFHMVGDNADQAAGGLYWRPFGPWLCSDMLKGDAVELGTCGDGLWSSVFNVYTDPHRVPDRISTILLLESRSLMIQMGGLEPHRNFDSPEE